MSLNDGGWCVCKTLALARVGQKKIDTSGMAGVADSLISGVRRDSIGRQVVGVYSDPSVVPKARLTYQGPSRESGA